MVHRLTPDESDQLRERVEQGEVIVCFSRCLVCGRRTPHEVCHAHADHNDWPQPLDAAWGTGYDLEPEVCADTTCPLWASS